MNNKNIEFAVINIYMYCTCNYLQQNDELYHKKQFKQYDE